MHCDLYNASERCILKYIIRKSNKESNISLAIVIYCTLKSINSNATLKCTPSFILHFFGCFFFNKHYNYFQLIDRIVSHHLSQIRPGSHDSPLDEIYQHIQMNPQHQIKSNKDN